MLISRVHDDKLLHARRWHTYCRWLLQRIREHRSWISNILHYYPINLTGTVVCGVPRCVVGFSTTVSTNQKLPTPKSINIYVRIYVANSRDSLIKAITLAVRGRIALFSSSSCNKRKERIRLAYTVVPWIFLWKFPAMREMNLWHVYCFKLLFQHTEL